MRAAGGVLLVACAVGQAAAGEKVAAAERSLPPAAVTEIGGFLGERCGANVERLLTFDVERYVRMVEEPKHRDWSWIGEQPGKWLEAAVEAGEQSHKAALREKAQVVLRRLVAAQEPGGYLGVTDPEVRTPRRPLRGMDPYELYFTLHALLTAHERWGDKAALAAARRLGDYLVEHVAPGKAEFWPVPNDVTIAGHSVHYGLEGTLLAYPMTRLHRLCGDAKYLAWSQWVVASIDRWSCSDTLSRLDQVAAGRMGIHQIQPNVHAHTLHMNLLGLLELYRVTGDASLLRKARGAWRDIIAYRMYLTGGVSVGEVYRHDHHLPNTGSVVETCATMSWMLLNQRLLELTGEPEFADIIERLLWNHLPAAQTADGDGWRYHTPLAGWKPEGCFTGPDCCSSSGPRIVAKLPTLIYAASADGLVVNQFVPSAARVKLSSGNEVAVRVVTDFPAGETVAVEVAPARAERFAVRVRLPGWCEEPRVAVNGEAVAVKERPPTYAVLEREWKQGDRVELRLPMHARWVAGHHTSSGLYAFVRGPVVFALDSIWADAGTRRALVGDGKGEPLPGLAGVVLDPDAPTAGFAPVRAPAGTLGPGYEVRIALDGGRRARATVLPFANIGTWYRSDAERRSRTGQRDAYAIWLREATSGRFRSLDLRAAVNVHSSARRGLFTSPAARGEVFAFPHYGRFRVRAVPFDVLDPATNNGRNLLILRGGPANALAQQYPTRVAVPVGFRCRAVHLLGGVGGWAFPFDKGRKPALTLRIRYEDAPTQDVALVNGEHLADYNGQHDVPGSRAALTLGPHQLRTLRVRTNPRSPITRIELLDAGTPVAPIAAAITAELPLE